MLRIAWENRSDLGYAWKVLTRGVCDGCALGTSGLSDWTLDDLDERIDGVRDTYLRVLGVEEPGAVADAAELSAQGGAVVNLRSKRTDGSR